MYYSSQKKIIYSLICVFAIAVVIIYLIMHKVFSEHLHEDMHSRATEILDIIDYMASISSESRELTKGITTLGANRDIKLIVISTDDPSTVIASNKHAFIGLPITELFSNYNRELSIFFSENNINSTVGQSILSFEFKHRKNEFFALAPIWIENIFDSGKLDKGTVALVFDTTDAQLLANKQKLTTSFALILMMLCALGVVYLMTTKHIFSPLDIINNILKKNMRNDTYKPIPVIADDEIGTVANTLNKLFSDLYESKMSIKQQKERYDLALQGTKVGLLDWDIINDKLYCSPTACELLGAKNDAFICDFEWLVNKTHEDDREFLRSSTISHFKFDTKFDVDCRLRHEDGHYLWVRARGQAVRDKSGKAVRVVGYFVDISRRKEQENFMHNFYMLISDAKTPLESRLNNILKETSSYLKLAGGIICEIKDDQYHIKNIFCPSDYNFTKESILDVNDTLCSYTIDKDEIVAIHDVSRSPLKNIAAHTITGINSYIAMPLHINGKIYGTINFFDKKIRQKPFEEREKAFVRFVSQWVSNELMRAQYINYLHETEDHLEQVISELTNANVELENFVYVASHDLQEPLRMITNFSGLLETQISNNLDRDAKKYLNYMSQSATQMRELLKGLLAYARASQDDEKTETIDTFDILCHVTNNLGKQITESGAKISYDKTPLIIANKVSMISLLQNLISNAIKFQVEGNQPKIHINISDKIDEWKFEIKDNGIGINPIYKDKIFEPFKRLHTQAEFSGTGIGLAVCKKIVARMNGTIWAEPNDINGTSIFFTISKPLTQTGKAA